MAKVVGRLNDEYIKLTVYKYNKPILIRKDAICTILPALDGENGYNNIEGRTWLTTINDSDFILVEESFDTICEMLDA